VYNQALKLPSELHVSLSGTQRVREKDRQTDRQAGSETVNIVT